MGTASEQGILQEDALENTPDPSLIPRMFIKHFSYERPGYEANQIQKQVQTRTRNFTHTSTHVYNLLQYIKYIL